METLADILWRVYKLRYGDALPKPGESRALQHRAWLLMSSFGVEMVTLDSNLIVQRVDSIKAIAFHDTMHAGDIVESVSLIDAEVA